MFCSSCGKALPAVDRPCPSCGGKDHGGPMGSFNSDIVFQDGQFTQWPEGTQQ